MHHDQRISTYSDQLRCVVVPLTAQEPCSPADGLRGTAKGGPLCSGEKQDAIEHGRDLALSAKVTSKSFWMMTWEGKNGIMGMSWIYHLYISLAETWHYQQTSPANISGWWHGKGKMGSWVCHGYTICIFHWQRLGIISKHHQQIFLDDDMGREKRDHGYFMSWIYHWYISWDIIWCNHLDGLQPAVLG